MNRIFIHKRDGFDVISSSLSALIQNQLKIDVSVDTYLGYDLVDLDPKVLPEALMRVFSEAMSDEILTNLPNIEGFIIAKEPLPGQYDQRSDAAEQCLRLLDFETQASVKTFEVVLFNRVLTESERERFTSYWINPIEMREKSLTQAMALSEPMSDEGEIQGFTNFNDEQAKAFLAENKAAMTLADLTLIKDFFKTHESRQPTMTEFKVLDTYWSDHCRHTTFETQLKSIMIPQGPYEAQLKNTLALFNDYRAQVKRSDKPITLMEMATIGARAIDDKRVEHSEEINACSVKVDVKINNTTSPWLLQFKNETHNHPTEIEPFGGASTCIGGAIRDPLSGRAYVYQAMRISGCGNVKESLVDTLAHKLPQRVIATRATQGNSAYGNQIGVATTYVKEIYHPRYTAKHLELGAVVGAVRVDAVKRQTPQENDVIVLLGGKTGRDGIGGATGSSLAHTSGSLTQCASEVQKGNAPEERKIQRLFRNPIASKMIKKCNDFGAGGISVAIGELADGLIIDLNKVPLKYTGLNATELAISESQERMAVVLDRQDVQAFINLAHEENLEATLVATVTSSRRLQMHHQGKLVVDLDRTLIDTNGVRQEASAILIQKAQPKISSPIFNQKNALEHLSSLNVTLQKGLIEQFDCSIGTTTVLMPLGGKSQLSPTQGSVQKIAVVDQESSTVSILTHGFIPELSEINPYLSAQGALLEAIAKTIALGGKVENIFFSLQEYFPKLNADDAKWGSVVQALLGALSVQAAFKRPAIGGKDSMSGSYKAMDVLETLVAFACSCADPKDILPQQASSSDESLYLVKAKRCDNGLFDCDAITATYSQVQAEVQVQRVSALRVIEHGLFASVCALVFGNDLKAVIQTDESLLDLLPASFLIAAKGPVPSEWIKIGQVSDTDFRFNGIDLDYDQAKAVYLGGLDFLYPVLGPQSDQTLIVKDTLKEPNQFTGEIPKQVNVVIPVFPGTNCEDDTARAFAKAGGSPVLIAIRNLSKDDLQASLMALVKAIDNAHIVALPGGFSSGDEPDGSAKFIVNVLRQKQVKEAIENLLKRQGLILGICNGFQALIKTGLLPYGEYRELTQHDATLTHNTIHRHISAMAITRLSSNASPWLSSHTPGLIVKVPLSHGEGRLKVNLTQAQTWFDQGQVAFQYTDPKGQPTLDPRYNLNGSDHAIETLLSPSGQIMGKMGHTERIAKDLYKNIPDLNELQLFENGINYFRKR